MDTKKPNELSITEAARALRAKEFTVRELWDACAAAAQERNGELNAYLELFAAFVQDLHALGYGVAHGDGGVDCKHHGRCGNPDQD